MDLTDKQWKVVETLLSEAVLRTDGRGRLMRQNPAKAGKPVEEKPKGRSGRG